MDRVTQQGCFVAIPEISDYELRREYIRGGMDSSLQRLDQMEDDLFFLPINTEVMRRAALFWAQSRQRGKPTADRHALDADAILAAQAVEVGGMVVTENPGHLQQWVSVKHWRDF